jgi:hypothetical protein
MLLIKMLYGLHGNPENLGFLSGDFLFYGLPLFG